MNLPEFGIEIAGYFGKYELRIDEKDEFPKLLKQVYSKKSKSNWDISLRMGKT